MAAHRKKLALAAMTGAIILGLLYLAVAGRSRKERGAPELAHSSDVQSEVAEKVKQTATEVSDRLAPVVAWKLRMLRYIGWY